MCLIAQVLIRWAIQNGTSVIPKATGVSHIQGNLEALNFELSKDEFEVSCSPLCKCLSNAIVLSRCGWVCPAVVLCLPGCLPNLLHHFTYMCVVCTMQWLVHRAA